ncbi:hypothetical protein OHD16_10410 [Sphingobacterium sp. ML3W]|uniref:hypothetical protein n=1 Tax=Sphingobacterium sp. ML3W TaxID=1538644 RepID=UPI002499ADD5|nr:hypothetical protein [Sphingobacterium sp. ML3W]WFA80372.1 hypothetical protein OGI71_03555 [Sphingobacterium sp. ML3W]
MANQFLVKETMAAMQGLSAAEITALQNGTYEGVQLLGYYEKGDTPAPIIYSYVNPLTDPDPGPEDGGSIIETGGIKLLHKFVGVVNGEYFGMQPSGGSSNIVIAQKIINYAIDANVERINFPKYFRFQYSRYSIPHNISIRHYGNSYEEKLFYNNIHANGTPVNELEVSSGYHTGLTLDNHDYIIPEIPESGTKRDASIVIRQNGFSTWQEHHNIFGKQIHDLNYKGIANILVISGATSDGSLIFRLNGKDYTVDIKSTDTEAIIRNKILAAPYDSYFNYKVISGQAVRIFPREHTAIIVSTNPTSTLFPVVIEGVTYNIPVLTTDSMVEVARKIAASPLIPDSQYYKYAYGVKVAIYNKLGGANVATSISILSNNTGADISANVTSYLNQYNAMTITSSGTGRPRIGLGMWAARNYTLEVADTFKVIADSDNNSTTGTEAVIGWENERANVRKLFRLKTSGELEVYANNNSTKIFGFSNAGSFYANRFYFLGTNRFIGQATLGAENAVYISNNVGSAYSFRMSDTNGIEYNQGGAWKQYLTSVPNASSTIKGLINQAVASANTATEPSALYSQAEMQAILTELRDLKDKMRTAGMLAS